MRSRARGIFVTLEGGEGTGKTTLISALRSAFEGQGHSVVVTREPGGTPLAEKVRRLALNPPEGTHWSPLVEALLMNAARRDHVEKLILPALNRGAFVLCDRFADSTHVYQGVCGGVSLGLLKEMERHVLSDAAPDMTLLLDLPVEEALARRSKRGTQDAFEARPIAFHEAVRQGFLGLAAAEPVRIVTLDASLPAHLLAEHAIKLIRSRLPDMVRRLT